MWPSLVKIQYTEGVRPGKKLQMLKRSAEEMYDASAAVLTKGLLNINPAGRRIIPGYFMTRKQIDRLLFTVVSHMFVDINYST